MRVVNELDLTCPNCQRDPILFVVSCDNLSRFDCPYCDFSIGIDLAAILHDPRSLATWKEESQRHSSHKNN